ncbi:MAG: DUF2167 domain-containing protein [Planctomycetota bacterium]
MIRCLYAGFCALILLSVQAAETLPKHEFSPQTGRVTIGADLATIDLPEGMQFMPPSDARYILETLWKNPKDESVLGMVVADADQEDTEPVFVVFSYVADGHVADDDASGINYDALLTQMQEATREQSQVQEQQGYRSIALIGWAEPPHYDADKKKLYWAKSLKVGGQQEPALNYCIRILGRTGVLEINALGKTAELKRIGPVAQRVMLKTEFAKGNRYEDYQEGTDLKAAGGITALIVGGALAKKLGILALIGLGFLKFFKFLVIPIALFGGWLYSWFKKRGEQKKAAEHDELAELERRRLEEIKRADNPD